MRIADLGMRIGRDVEFKSAFRVSQPAIVMPIRLRGWY